MYKVVPELEVIGGKLIGGKAVGGKIYGGKPMTPNRKCRGKL